eukprot:881127-Prymnesium_polylepis.1
MSADAPSPIWQELNEKIEELEKELRTARRMNAGYEAAAAEAEARRIATVKMEDRSAMALDAAASGSLRVGDGPLAAAPSLRALAGRPPLAPRPPSAPA